MKSKWNFIRGKSAKFVVYALLAAFFLQAVSPLQAFASESVETPVETVVTEEASSEEVASEEVISEETSEDATSEDVTEEASEEIASEDASEEAVSEETTEEAASEETSEETTEEAVSEETSEETTEEVVSEEVSEETTEEAVSEEATETKEEDGLPEVIILNGGKKPEVSEYGLIPEEHKPATSKTYMENGLMEEIPSSYKSPYITSVKNQNPYGTCWAFATVALLEANAVKKGLFETTPDFSERHLAHNVYNRKGIDDPLGNTLGDYMVAWEPWYDNGGNLASSTKHLMNWQGPTTEAAVPYSGEDVDKSSFFDSELHMINTEEISLDNPDAVKSAIIKYGAVAVSYYHSDGFLNESTGAYYNNVSNSTNHAVTIIGWDDDYATSNFLTAPSSKGAWLVKNSWGTWFANDGYFWISYEDTSLANVYSIEVDSVDNYDHNFFYTGGYAESYFEYINIATAGNIFTNTLSDPQYIKAVSVQIASADTDCSVQIYKNPTDNAFTGTPMLATEVKESFYHPGYYTIEIPYDNIIIEPGEKFSVVITATSRVTDGPCNIVMDMDYPDYDFYATATPGTSFMKTASGRVTDVSANEYCYTFRIGAYTVDSPTTAELSETAGTLTLSTGLTEYPVKDFNITSNRLKDTDFTWTSSDTQVATVDANGVVTGLRPGTATITATNPKFTLTASVTVSLAVTATDITAKNAAYTGSPIKTAVSVSYTIAGTKTTLTENTHYTLAYANNTAIGTAQVTVTGVGCVTGSKTVSFEIKDGIPLEAVLEENSFIYNGSEWKPTVIVTAEGEILTENQDYTVTYSNNINAALSTADKAPTVTVTACAGTMYKGSVVLKFTISPKSVENLFIYSNTEMYRPEDYTEAELQEGLLPSMHVEDGENLSLAEEEFLLMAGRDYFVTYENNDAIGVAKATINGMGNYTGVGEAYFTIQGIDINKLSFDKIPAQLYQPGGTKAEPVPNATSVQKYKLDGVTYNYVYQNHTKAGTAKVTVYAEADSKVTGSKTLTYKIAKRNINADNLVIGYDYVDGQVIESIAEIPYTGAAIKPMPYIACVIDGKQELLQYGVDYKLSYAKNVNAGSVAENGTDILATGEIIIKGAGNYSGTFKEYFKILPVDLNSAAITVNAPEAIKYTGKVIKPSVTLTYASATGKNIKLKANKDYKIVATENGLNGGSVEVAYSIVPAKEGSGNYTGTINKTVWVSNKPASSLKVTIAKATRTYTGNPITLDASEITVKDGKNVVDPGNYTVEYNNTNVNAGKATATIRFNGPVYYGTTTATFVISPAALTSATASFVTSGTHYYSGYAITLAEDEYSITHAVTGENLVANEDFKLKYSKNVNAGVASITATGKGNYKGSIKASFEIQKLAAFDASHLVITTEDCVYNGKAQKGNLAVYYNPGNGADLVLLKSGGAYSVSYKNNKNAGDATATIKLKGTKNVSGAVEVLTETFTIEKYDLADATISAIAVQKYNNGKAVCPKPVVKMDKTSLKVNKDYKLVYSSNTARGTASITITGMGNCEGEVVLTFIIR